MIEDNLEYTAVRIEEQDGSIIGSGVLWINPEDTKYSYVFTAGHIVEDKSIRINIKKDNESIIKNINSEEIRFHNKYGFVEDRYEFDVAIIRTEKIDFMTNDNYRNIIFGNVKRNKKIIGRGFLENGWDRIFKLSGHFIEGSICNDVDSSTQRFQININTSVDSGSRDDELLGYSGTGIFSKDDTSRNLVLLGILSHGQGVDAAQGIVNCFDTKLITDIFRENSWDSPEKELILPEICQPNVVLFINYAPKCEHFYIERDQDLEFNECLKINNVWVFGKSGAGKTTLIHRNLIQNDTEYCYCDLSPIAISKSEDVFNEILCTLEEKYDIRRNLEETNLLKQINQIICKSGFSKTVIVVDELAVDDSTVLKNIADNFIRLVIHFNNQHSECDLKFVISTISNPSHIIQNRSKAGEYFQYICCDYWVEHFPKLFVVLCKALNLDLDKSEKLIIENSKNSPRIIKAIFKKIIIYKDTSECMVDKAIKMTLKEVVE